MEYSCRALKYASSSHVQKLHVFLSKCIPKYILDKGPWYFSYRKLSRIWVFNLPSNTRKSEVNDSSQSQFSGTPFFYKFDGIWACHHTEIPYCHGGELLLSLLVDVASNKLKKSAQLLFVTVFGHPDWDFPCFSSVVSKCHDVTKKDFGTPTPNSETFNKICFSSYRWLL
jgi:hypothetical protein